MTLPKVTLDGVEFSLVPALGCSTATGTPCHFYSSRRENCSERRHRFCNRGPEDQCVLLDDAGLLKHLTAKLTG